MGDGPHAARRAADLQSRTLVAAGRSSARDTRLDVFRGLALITIYINHVPGTLFEYITTRNFGFSDAAEGFVIMSGIAAGLAYGTIMANGAWSGARRIWARAWTLYTVHIVTTVMAIGLSAAAARWLGAAKMIEINNVAPFFQDALGVLIGLPTLGHQLGYFNILPLYMVLLLVTPALILLGREKPWLLVTLSVLVWIVAGSFRLNFPNYPNPGGWFFNPFAWQLIFVLGLLTGMAMRRGERLVPYDARLFWACVSLLVFVLVWRFVPPVGRFGREMFHAAFDSGVPFYMVSFDKTFVALPRLLHVLALFYVISAIPRIGMWSSSAWARPVAMMGRFGLPVFAAGSVLSIAAQSVKAAFPESFVLDAWLILGGIALQFLVALAFALVAAQQPAIQAKAKSASLS